MTDATTLSGKDQVADYAPLLDKPEDHPQQVVATYGDSDVVIMDSARYADERNEWKDRYEAEHRDHLATIKHADALEDECHKLERE